MVTHVSATPSPPILEHQASATDADAGAGALNYARETNSAIDLLVESPSSTGFGPSCDTHLHHHTDVANVHSTE